MDHVFSIVGAGRSASGPLKERSSKWLENMPGSNLTKAGGVYATGSFRDPTVFARFTNEFAAVGPTMTPTSGTSGTLRHPSSTSSA